MAEKNVNEELNEDFDVITVEFETEDGSVLTYVQDLVIDVDGQDYAVLIGLNTEDDPDFDEEENVIVAKIVKDANGEDEYVDLTDEEFEAFQAAYDEYCDAEGIE